MGKVTRVTRGGKKNSVVLPPKLWQHMIDSTSVRGHSQAAGARGGLIRRLLVDRAAAARLLPLYTPAHEPEEVLADLEVEIIPELPLGVVLLGMGADMHTASLFPGADGLAEALAPDASPAVAISAPDAGEARVTLSVPVLAAAERHILIQGADKREALRRAVEIANPLCAPICAVLDGAVVHYAD